ncbi:hypothetical protein BJX68DRAFT_261206 [Aspergillus pseudodeflectus]|uniref:Uncharacterized protein n=1 Tax=Aspergillus pseudodeflectus TaxID=176178 RepID=A0ABR4L6V7_9EURO
MSSTDYNLADPHTKHRHSHNRHHPVAASPVPTYANRGVPTYSMLNQEPIGHSSNLPSPRYSPNVQPWKRQQPQNSLSFIPSTSPRSEQSEYTTSQPRRIADRGAACISPFRSVRKMKEPFQLRLPTSPSIENGSSSIGDARVTSRQPELRSLRAWRSDQNLMASSLETFGLLPSPPLSDSHTPQASPSSTYFSSKPGRGIESFPLTTGRCTPHATATDIPAQHHSTESTNVHMAHSNLVRQYEMSDGQFTPSTTDSGCMSPPATCSDTDSVGTRNFSGSSAATHRSRSGTVSSEGSWVPSSLSYCETWLQGAPIDSAEEEPGKSTVLNRRKFQIVQQSPFLPDWKRAHNDAVLAVKSKTKPKLVDISRQSSPAMSYSLPTPTHILPATPDQSLPEVSAFSPDTPLEMSDSGYATNNLARPPKEQEANKENTPTESGSVVSGDAGETVICDVSAENNARQKPHSTTDMLSEAVASQPQASPSASSSKVEKEELEKWWDLEWTIDQLEHSVKEFPQNILRLTSPVVMFLRRNQERSLIRPFRQIFPDAPESLLDSLCAVLIAKNYLLSLPSSSRRAASIPPRAQFTKLDTVPEKASSILGMKFAQPPPSRIRDQVLGSRSGKLHQDFDRIVDDLLSTLHGPPDEALKSATLVLIQVLETKA